VRPIKYFGICKVLFVISLIFGMAFHSYSQGIMVKADLDTTTILIGDQIHINLFVEQPQGEKISFPFLHDSIANKIEILSASKIDTYVVGNGRLRLLQRYLITCFDSGVYQIPPMSFSFTYGAIKDSLATQPLVLTVNSIPIKDPKKIYDIKGVIAMPLTFSEILPYIISGLVLLLIIALIIYIRNRLKHNKPVFFLQKPKEPAHIIAFRELEKLRSEKLWQQGQIKQYHTRITDIIRTYIEDRFNILAMESTSDEILDDLKKIEIVDSKALNGMKQLMETADLAKFAKAEPMPDENENSWRYAYDFVVNTLKKPEEDNVTIR
jgi:hypothetical protein